MSDTRIRTDVFPAYVTINPALKAQEDEPQILEKARVVVTGDTVYVFKDSPTGPALVYSDRLQSYDPGVPVHRRTRSRPARTPSLVTESGDQVSFGRSGSCGCGSRLKSFDPFPQISQVASTKDR
jgi:hypothetical protein